MTMESLSMPEYIFALWKLITRPPRRRYTRLELCGPYGNRFRVGNTTVSRVNYTVVNARGIPLVCTLFEPELQQRPRGGEPLPERACVVFCHGNACSRLDGFEQVHALLPLNIALCCFDFAGSGMSGGEYVSLGFFEREDLAAVVDNLRGERGFSCVGVWGRSMGASTAVLHTARDPTLAGVVADSPFSDLWKLMQEICSTKIKLPSMASSPVLQGIRFAVQQQAGFDVCEVSPAAHLDNCFVPALFLHGEQDDFVVPKHSEDLKKGWQGEATRLLMPETDHNCQRPQRFIARSALFFVRAFRWEAHVENRLALAAITEGLLPTTENQRTMQCRNQGSEGVILAEHQLQQQAVSRGIYEMATSPDPGVRRRGVLLAAAELSGAYRGAESLQLEGNLHSSLDAPAFQGNSIETKFPACFKGDLCLGSHEVEVAFSWVAGFIPSVGHCIYFAVVSSRVLSLSRVVLRATGGEPGQAGFAGFLCNGVEPITLESVEIELATKIDLELRMTGGLSAELLVGGDVIATEQTPTGSAELPASIELSCWCWRPRDAVVKVSLAAVEEVPPSSPRCWDRRTGSSAGRSSAGQAPKEQLADELASLCLGTCRQPSLPLCHPPESTRPSMLASLERHATLLEDRGESSPLAQRRK
eukprot:TRINITY_DN69676_c0_g1_i1.p1 TRINITY_DN69676_c0_g1~~TRINITY_DN69676_c0_g1_i1.p1  ORF type:complete len:645 (-),score=109.80 TRINITY_DN69676_c0_g1_i1:30-1964(-)